MSGFLKLITIKDLNTIHGKAQCDKLVCVLECKHDRQIHCKSKQMPC